MAYTPWLDWPRPWLSDIRGAYTRLVQKCQRADVHGWRQPPRLHSLSDAMYRLAYLENVEPEYCRAQFSLWLHWEQRRRVIEYWPPVGRRLWWSIVNNESP